MTRILVHAVHPDAGTGYAEQCGLWVPRFASLGHEVAISAFAGAPMAMSEWNGFTVYPGGNHRYGADVLPRNARHFRPDLVITLCDLWALGSTPFPAMPHVRAACWMPVDCTPLGCKDRRVLNNARVTPVAMSRHGEKMIRDAGSRPLYVPHGCFDYDAPVTIVPGRREKLGDLATGRVLADSVVGVGADGIPRRSRILKRHVLPLMDSHALRVTAESGRSMIITRDNEVMTNLGWVRAGDLNTSLYIYTVDVEGGENGSTLDPGRDGTIQAAVPDHAEGGTSGGIPGTQLPGHAGAGATIGSGQDWRGVFCSPQSATASTLGCGTGLHSRDRRRRGAYHVHPIQARSPRPLDAEGRHLESVRGTDSLAGRAHRMDAALTEGGQDRVGLGVPAGASWSQFGRTLEGAFALSGNQGRPGDAGDPVLRDARRDDAGCAGNRGATGGCAFRAGAERQAGGTFERIGAIEPVSLTTVFDLTTETGNFLVDGMLVHNCDTAVFRPPADRAELRRDMDIHDRFVIGICKTNNDGWRAGWFEQLSAFAKLHRKHDDALLIGHTDPEAEAGIDLRVLADQLGIKKAVRWTVDYATRVGPATPGAMAAMAGAEDLRSGCAWGEGFCLPVLEAQACGTPAVATDASAMAEVCGGWLVPGEEKYIREHQASWVAPSIDGIARVYEKAYQRGPAYQAKKASARDHAMQYDADLVLKRYWVPALEALL